MSYQEKRALVSLIGTILISAFYLRYMLERYDAAAFSASVPDGGWITGLWFVSDAEVGRQWGSELPSVELNLSITTKGPDQLSSSFAENVGQGAVAVHPKGSLHVESTGKGAAVFIGFDSPFLYYPTDGNLLLEVKNFEKPIISGVPALVPGPLDAWNIVGDPVSRVYAIGNANATAGTADSLGLTTFFVVTPIPEPSTSLLLGLGLCAVGWKWLSRRRH